MTFTLEVVMSFLRFLMLLSLVVWIGGLIFLHLLWRQPYSKLGFFPSHQLAGNVVNRSLGLLHGMAIVCGIVFAVTSMIDSRW